MNLLTQRRSITNFCFEAYSYWLRKYFYIELDKEKHWSDFSFDFIFFRLPCGPKFCFLVIWWSSLVHGCIRPSCLFNEVSNTRRKTGKLKDQLHEVSYSLPQYCHTYCPSLFIGVFRILDCPSFHGSFFKPYRMHITIQLSHRYIYAYQRKKEPQTDQEIITPR